MRQEIQQAIVVGVLAFAVTMGLLLVSRTEPEPEPEVEAPAVGGASVRIRLVEADGRPVTACGATLWAELPDGSRRADPDSSRECVDGLVWTGKEPGAYHLMALGTRKVMVERRFELKEGDSIDFGDVVMEPGGRVKGRVIQDGVPVSNAQVRLPNGRMETTNPKGEFTMDGAPVGTLDLRAAKGRSGGGLSVELVEGGQVDVEIPIEPVPPVGVLGLRYDVLPEGLQVRELHPAGPAAGAGITVGALILSIDGKPAQELDSRGARAIVVGPVGSTATVVVKGEDGPRTFTFARVGDDTLQDP